MKRMSLKSFRASSKRLYFVYISSSFINCRLKKMGVNVC